NNLRRGATIKEWNLSVLDSMLADVGFIRNTPAGSSIFVEAARSTEYEFAEDHIVSKRVEVRDVEYDRNFVKRDPDVYIWGRDFTKTHRGYFT
ncbi:MAG: hypothetical protein IJ791_08280, partial [Lachnospiraceae bacterium]|nr:hypothetical protein [Lachnospiraceae bacterium]